jgi:hypothetical protein
MKTTMKTLLAIIALSATALAAHAQDAGGPPDGDRPPRQGGPGNGGPGMYGRRMPPPSPLMDALDANHDGIIDSNEIANASAALKKLDKNGDGKLTPDELRPQRPQHFGGGQGGPPGPDSQRPPQGPSGQDSLRPPQGPPGDN